MGVSALLFSKVQIVRHRTKGRKLMERRWRTLPTLAAFRRTLGLCAKATVLSFAAFTSQQAHSQPRDVARALRIHSLPAELREISGLSVAGPDAVFAHDDEIGRIYKINTETGESSVYFSIGTPPVKGDFEAVVVKGEALFVVSSDGLIFESEMSGGAAASSYAVYNTGLAKQCEIEGAADDGADGLILACKKTRGAKKKSRIVLYRWSASARFEPPERIVDIDLGAQWSPVSGRRFAPSGLDRLKDGRLLVIDSASGGLAVLDAHGGLENLSELGAKAHPQAEGVATMPDGSLVVADEGGDGAGRLTVYSGIPR